MPSNYKQSKRMPLSLNINFVIMNVASMFDTTTGQGKTTVVEIVYPLIAQQNSVDQDQSLHVLSEAIGVTQEELRASLPH